MQGAIVRASLAALLSFFGACSTNLSDGAVVNARELVLAGFALNPSTAVQFDFGALNFDGTAVVWKEDQVTTHTGRAPAVQAGAICPNSPALYPFETKVDARFAPWVRVGDGQLAHVFLRGDADGTALFFPEDHVGAVECVVTNAPKDCDFWERAQKCGFTLHEIELFTDPVNLSWF